MSTYIIGDVQGCFDSLIALLNTLHFNPEKDRLGFVGDLVNRGPKSLETVLFVMQLKNPMIVLGNHDLHLLALYFADKQRPHVLHSIPHTLHAVLTAKDAKACMDFLLQQKLIWNEREFLMVHAGIPPQWDMHQALQYAHEAEMALKQNPAIFFEHMYGNQPEKWQDSLIGWERIRYIINALTRMRFCTHDGILDLEKQSSAIHENPGFQPWFKWCTIKKEIYFGHWAALNGECEKERIHALDTGCVWGGRLTAIRLEDHQRFSVAYI